MAQVAIAAIPAVASLAGRYMADKTNRKGMKIQQAANASAMAFERQKYEEEKKAAAEDRAYRNAIRKAWADRHGVAWSPSTGGTGGRPAQPVITLGGKPVAVAPSDGTGAALARMDGGEPGAEEFDPNDWNRWA